MSNIEPRPCRCPLCITALRATHDLPVARLWHWQEAHRRMVAYRDARARARRKGART